MNEFYIIRDGNDVAVSNKGYASKEEAKKERNKLNAALKENKDKKPGDKDFVARYVVSRGPRHPNGPSKSRFYAGPARPRSRRK